MLLEAGLPQEMWQQILTNALRELSSTDIFAFGEYVFGYEAAPHHRELINFMLDCVEERENGVALEPRGHAKTTWGNTIFLSWLVAKYLNIRVGLISNTAKQSNAFSRAIRWTLEANERYKEVFGFRVGPHKWTDVEWIQRDSMLHASKDVTMYSAGAGGAIISKRFDLILCDDILDEENTANIEQQEKIETWFWKTLKPCLTPGGVILVLGTRWAEGDLYEKLITPENKGGKGWRSLVRGAFSYDEKDVDQSEPRALWPQVWPVEALMGERRDMGSAMFACSYMNDISGLMAGNVFRKEWFQYFDFLPVDRKFTIRMGVDLASSEKERADFTARATVAEDDQGNFYILSIYRDKRETHHAEFIYDGWSAYDSMALVVCESQQFQSTLIQEVMRDYPRIPIEGKKADVDKTTRARAVAAKYEGRRVWHHRSLQNTEFETELLSFPKGHDDMVDAVGYAMDLGGGGMVFGALRR
jgi:predicted phage terminase large subunit-like protein